MRNWLILFSYFCASFLNGTCWVVLVSIPDKGEDYYDINQGELALYGVIASVISVPLAPISGWLVSKSFFYSLHIVWIVSLIGCWIRFLAGTNFWISLFGQTILFLGNMLILSSCSTLAMLWFPKSKILLATTIASFSNFFGIGFGFVYMPYEENIPKMIFMQAIFASVFFVFNLVVLRKCDKKEIVLSFKDSFFVAFKNKTLSLMIFCSGSALGLNYALVGILGLLLSDENYSELETGWAGFAYLFSGLIGGLLATYISEYKRSITFSLKLFLMGSILSSVLFSGFISFIGFSFVAASLFGGFLTGSLPLCIRCCVKFMPEIDETVPTNMIYLISMIFSIVYTYPMLYFKQFTTISGIWVGSLLVFVSYGFLLVVMRKVRDSNSGKRTSSEFSNSCPDEIVDTSLPVLKKDKILPN